MAKFNLENYETVEDRLKKFWKDYPKGRIQTEILHITTDGQCVTIQASIYKNEEDARPVSTGIAQETKGQGGFANADAWMENAETSALGRSLSNWIYQGSGKPRPSREEMSKVSNSKPDTSKKKQVVQESGESPSKPIITELALKKMVMSRCNDDKTFASKCYKQCMERTIIKTNIDNVDKWTQETIKVFEDLVGIYIDKHKDTFEERTNNEPIVNKIIENLGEVVEKEQEVADIPEGKWMDDPISDGQVKFIETLIKQVIDDGQDELGAEAKQYLSSGEATKGNASKMIDKLKDALS
jgi:hypothetical protein